MPRFMVKSGPHAGMAADANTKSEARAALKARLGLDALPAGTKLERAELEWDEWPQSSNVMAGRYDAEARVLSIRFKDGSRYDYREVPPSAWAGMLAAESKGQALHQLVKRAGYSYSKVSA